MAHPLGRRGVRTVSRPQVSAGHHLQRQPPPHEMVHKLSELLGTVKTKTTPYHPRSDGLVDCFNRTLLAMLAMFISREHFTTCLTALN